MVQTRRDKIVKNSLIIGASTFVLYQIFKPKKPITPIVDSGFPNFFFSPVPNLTIRDDPAGSGLYKARRSGVDGAHEGVDYLAENGQIIVAPMDGIMKRIEMPYRNDPKYFGLVIDGTGIYQNYEMTIYYTIPTVVNGQSFFAGEAIGIAQDISTKWGGGMLDHLHIEVRLFGRLIDPTQLFQRTT